MPDADKNFRGSLVLDFKISWSHVKTIYRKLTIMYSKTKTDERKA